MKLIQRTIGVLLVSAVLALTPGCDTAGSGAAAGGVFGGALGSAIGIATGHPELGAAIGVAAGMFTGAVIGAMNEQQRNQLQAQSPQTMTVIQHNDAVYQQQQQAAASPPPAGTPAPAPAEAPTPLTVDNVSALVAVGLKPEAIIAEIQRSKSVFTQADITALKTSNPNVDPSVIDCMKKTMAS
jgi:type II secretory pathway pseudopilin PulG